ncbi:hypothetical protein PL10110_280048 [Planktothrix agardhii]|nr:hypothetical protein PL10110_280048 [Planktothrix agardhii]
MKLIKTYHNTIKLFCKSSNDYQVLEPVDWLPKEVGNTVFKPPYEYIWNHLGCEHLWDYYNRVIME